LGGCVNNRLAKWATLNQSNNKCLYATGPWTKVIGDK